MKDRSGTQRDPDTFYEIYGELARQTDRAAVIIGASLIEDRLRLECLKEFEPNLTNTLTNLLTGSEGALGTFSRTIDLSRSIGVITERERKILHLVRAMRNHCAHSIRMLSFKDKELSDCVEFLQPITSFFKFKEISNKLAMVTFQFFVVYFNYRLMERSSAAGIEAVTILMRDVLSLASSPDKSPTQ